MGGLAAGARVLIAAITAGWLIEATPAKAGCLPDKRVEIPIRLQDGFALVPARIGVTPVSLLLDTGAQGMLLTPEIVSALQLPADPRGSTRLLGTGGSRDAPNAMLRGLALGSVSFAESSVPVAALPGVPRTDPPLAGLLGAQFLAAYDLDLDVPNGRMTLFGTAGCAGPPFRPPYNVLPLQFTPEGDAFITVQVNGVSLLALVDTGSRASIMTERAAQRLGLGGPPSANLARGVDGSAAPIRHLRVRTLQVGAEVVANAPVSVSPLLLGRGDMLLGLDYLGQRRVWISLRSGLVVIR